MTPLDLSDHLQRDHGFQAYRNVDDPEVAAINNGVHLGLHVQAGRDGTEDHTHAGADNA